MKTCWYEWHASLASIFQNLVVDYPLVVSYNQQCQIETNVNYLCAIIISIQLLLSYASSCAKLWINLITLSHNCHMSKCHGVFTKIFTIFFSNVDQTEHVPDFEFERF